MSQQNPYAPPPPTSRRNPYAPPGANLSSQSGSSAPELWNPDAAGAWSLLLTPVFGSILLLMNAKALGDSGRVNMATLWLVISVIIMPGYIIPGLAFVYIIVWYFLAQRPQSKYVSGQWGKSYPRRPMWLAVLIGFGVWIVVVIVLTVILMAIAQTAA